MYEDGQIVIEGKKIELRMESSLKASVLRKFLGATPIDSEIDSLSIPKRPFWLFWCVLLLRLYRKLRPLHISQRCVFDPSCSRYAELSFRKYGFIKGCQLTINRLKRCKSGAGGIDRP